MNRIKDILSKQGRSQTWLAHKLGKSYNMVNSYVQNRRQPSIEILYKIAHFLEVDVRLLLLSKEEEEQESSKLIKIPILGTASCGKPILAIEDREGDIPISKEILSPGEDYYILRASGTSMDKSGINDGDLVLIRKQNFASNGQNVVALIEDEVTIKEFQHQGELVILKPNSTDLDHTPIVLSDQFRIQGVVERIINL